MIIKKLFSITIFSKCHANKFVKRKKNQKTKIAKETKFEKGHFSGQKGKKES
jgi:hypothetical protein